MPSPDRRLLCHVKEKRPLCIFYTLSHFLRFRWTPSPGNSFPDIEHVDTIKSTDKAHLKVKIKFTLYRNNDKIARFVPRYKL